MEQVVSEEYSKITNESNDPDNSLISNYSTIQQPNTQFLPITKFSIFNFLNSSPDNYNISAVKTSSPSYYHRD